MQLEGKNICFKYNTNGKWILKNVNICISSGEIVGLIGESGCGKSTLAKILSGYINPCDGEVLWNKKPLPKTGFCPVQMIHQHPELSVNPRQKMYKILHEGDSPDDDTLQAVGIKPEWMQRWPGELSGGELQRFCIARAVGNKTKFLICDEITTMLDTITQAQIWQTILNIVKKNNLGMLIITHNITLAQKICTRTITIPTKPTKSSPSASKAHKSPQPKRAQSSPSASKAHKSPQPQPNIKLNQSLKETRYAL